MKAKDVFALTILLYVCGSLVIGSILVMELRLAQRRQTATPGDRVLWRGDDMVVVERDGDTLTVRRERGGETVRVHISELWKQVHAQ